MPTSVSIRMRLKLLRRVPVGARAAASCRGRFRRSSTSCCGLPEEKVRADRRAEHGDQGGQEIGIEADRWHQQPDHDLAPRHLHHQDGRRIGEQRQASAISARRRSGCIAGTPQHDREQPEDDERILRSADQQFEGRAHAANVGAEIDDVRHQQHADDDAKQPAPSNGGGC